MNRSNLITVILVVPLWVIFIATAIYFQFFHTPRPEYLWGSEDRGAIQLKNLTNTYIFAEEEPEYQPQFDVFLHGSDNWRYVLQIKYISGARPITAKVVIDGIPYSMIQSDSYEIAEFGETIRRWTYNREQECINDDSFFDSKLSWSYYYFEVDFNPVLWEDRPPPAFLAGPGGAFTSRVLNLGLHWVPGKPYGTGTAGITYQGVEYPLGCWNTGVGCHAYSEGLSIEYDDAWPDQVHYTYSITNTLQFDVNITGFEITPIGPDTDDNTFEVANNLPILLEACGGVEVITIVHNYPSTPGFYDQILQLSPHVEFETESTFVEGNGPGLLLKRTLENM